MKRGKKSLRRKETNLKSSPQKRDWFLIFLFIFIAFSFFVGIKIAYAIYSQWPGKIIEKEICGDGTAYGICSKVKPYFCLSGNLIEYSPLCGCPQGFDLEKTTCKSQYQKNSKKVRLKYVLNGKLDFIDFEVYEDFYDFVFRLPRAIIYSDGDSVSRVDFKLNAISNEEQREFLMPLVIKIQNITNNKEDQLRIAISLVQNIPFGASDKLDSFLGEGMVHTRFPYEVIYDFEGVCGEKTDLLVFLLKELGYGVSFFYYLPENHEAVGVKCPVKKSFMNTGYCFVETTYPSIIGDNQVKYLEVGKLYSTPEIYLLSEGKSLSENMYEYRDAKKLIKIRESIDKRGKIGPFYEKTIDDLIYKYGLKGQYYK